MAVIPKLMPSVLESVSRKVRVIVNPVSGRGRHLAKLARLRKHLVSMRFETEILVTGARGDAFRYASEADPSTAFLVCVGGDGTLNEVANGNLENRVPIVMVPAGTGNILKKELRLPRRFRHACRLALEGQVRWLDAMQVGDRLSLLVTSAGFDSKIAREFSERSGTMRIGDYVWPIVRHVFGHHHTPMRVVADGEVLTDDAAHVVVGNTRSYGGPFEIANRAHPSDGKIDGVVMLGSSRMALMRYLWGAIRRRVDRCSEVLYRQVKRIEIHGPSTIPYQVDGDHAGFLPVGIEVLPRAIPIVTA